MTESRRDAERDAVAWALHFAMREGYTACLRAADKAIAALDAVRSPRGEDDEEYDPLPERPDPFERTMPLPSPQGEDHEAGIEAAIRAYGRTLDLDEAHPDDAVRAAIAAYLSRCPSPERDLEDEYHDEHQAEGREVDDRCGVCRPELAAVPSPERDTERLVEAARVVVTEALAGTLTHRKLELLVDVLAEFGGSDTAPERHAKGQRGYVADCRGCGSRFKRADLAERHADFTGHELIWHTASPPARDTVRLVEAARRLVDSMEGQEVCFCCKERLTMDSPQQGHEPECDYLALRVLAELEGSDAAPERKA